MINRVYFTNELSREDGITGQGYVELSESVNIDEVLDNSDPPSSAVFPSTAEFTTLCLLNVPPHMIPIEIIRFFNSHLSLIRSISIHRHAAASEKFFAVLHTNSFAATKTIFEEYNGQIISSVDKVHCIIYPVIQIVSTDQANESSTASSAALEPDNNEPSSCPVCLETISIENPMTITTCCNHRFHMECMMRLESDQCPVCR